MTSALRALTTGLIDYAGLFPPASLSMDQAVRNFDAYRHGEHRDMLSRFILPVQRLEEFENAAAFRLDEDPDPWHLSILGSGDPFADSEILKSFNLRHEGGAIIDVVEMRLVEGMPAERVREALGDVTVYVELAAGNEGFRDQVDTLRRNGLRAKLRTGGVTAAAIPESRTVLDFIAACAERRVPFKATAGLHHPIRCRRALTYEPDSPEGVMHGFVNLFLAAALVYESVEPEVVHALLLEEDASSLRLSDTAIEWRDHVILAEVIAEVRRSLAISFGSCSFDEPVSDLMALGWLPADSTQSGHQ